MHSGMSSCSGHYLSYVNVDIFRKNVDSGGEVNVDECSGVVHCEVIGNSDGAMEVDDGCLSTIDQCYKAEVPSMNNHKHRRNQGVKCGSSQSRATKVINGDSKASDKMSKSQMCQVRDCESSISESVCGEKTACDSQSNVKDGHVESEDLRCEERLAMEVDNEDTNPELVKVASKQTPIPTGASINDILGKNTRFKGNASIHRGTDIKDGRDSDDSSDEEEVASSSFTRIPCSMDITRFFKPIPKSGRLKTKSRTNVEISDQFCSPESKHPSLNTRSSPSSVQEGGNNPQPTDAVDCSTSSSFQTSHDSAFSTLKKSNLSEKVKSVGQPLCEATSLCGQTSNNHDLPTCSSGSAPFTRSKAKIEPGDKLYSNDSPPTEEFVKADSGEAICQDQPVTNADIKLDSAADNSWSNGTASNIGAHKNDSPNLNSKGFYLVSDGKNFKGENSCVQSNIDCSEKPISTSTWLKFDDAEVQEISAKDMEEILSQSSSCYSTPYLLFYYQC